MIVLAITNSKGGTGKTTSTVSLAGALADAGQRVLVIDLDPQGSASRWLSPPGRPAGSETSWSFEDRPSRALLGELALEDAIVRTAHDGLDLIPGNATLEQAARTLAGEPGGDAALRALLRQDLAAGAYDFVLVDTPPSLGTLVSCALVAATALLIPVEARYLGLEGLARILTTVERLGRRLERDLPVAAVLVCRVDRRAHEGPAVVDQVREFIARRSSTVPVHEIRENVRLSAAASSHCPITRFDPRAPGALDYRRVAEDLVARLC